MASESPRRRSWRNTRSAGPRPEPAIVDLSASSPCRTVSDGGITRCSARSAVNSRKPPPGAPASRGTTDRTVVENAAPRRSLKKAKSSDSRPEEAGLVDGVASSVNQMAGGGGFVGFPSGTTLNSLESEVAVLGNGSTADLMALKNGGLRRSPNSKSSESYVKPTEIIDLTTYSPHQTVDDDGIVKTPHGINSYSPRQPLPASRNGKNMGLTDVQNGGVRRSPRISVNCPKTSSGAAEDGKSPPAVTENGNSTGQMFAENRSLRRSPRTLTSTLKPAPIAFENGNSIDHVDAQLLKKAKVTSNLKEGSRKADDAKVFFVGDPIPAEEARRRWPHHYIEKGKRSNGRSITFKDNEDEFVSDVKCHYSCANITGSILNLGDCAYIKGEEGKLNYVGRIMEFFETIEGDYYFTAQWFFRAEDTVLREQAASHEKKRLFYSDIKNDNLLDCIVSKVRVLQVSPNVDLKPKCTQSCDFYYDMKYSLEYSTFYTMATEYDSEEKGDLTASNCSGTFATADIKSKPFLKGTQNNCESVKSELALLDLYSGCGGMSTGLCLGAHVAGVNLVTRWAVDFNEAACKSMELNHSGTQVRNESGDDFFELLKKWKILCKRYVVGHVGETRESYSRISKVNYPKKDSHDGSEILDGEYEVLRLVDICYGDPSNTGKRGLKFKVRWKGYGPSNDSWEPIERLRNCQHRIREFVSEGFKSKILPLPGDVDVVCGGPPCQGISGLNRHRNFDAPLDDEKTRQIVVFMDIVQFLKPKYVLLENVVDILRFATGTLGRYALSRLVFMNYQTRVGIMAAGCYGLPQFRLRVFFWGSHPCERLPPFPLPTHDVILKGGAPSEFERNVVGYDEDQSRVLEKALVLEDVLSDLPAVTCHEVLDQMPYGRAPQTEFQRYIRSSKCEMMGSAANGIKKTQHSVLYDHCPLQLKEDSCLRVCKIPKKKGACFRDLPGVVVQPDNSVQWDPTMERVLLPSGNPLVPDCIMKFWDGKSTRPYARLWWDETVPTVLTSPDPHYQAIIHPEQDRVLTVRENARLQGFPDFYRFYGTIKERYSQIGNAVAVPVGRALGYAMGMAWLTKESGEQPLVTLPPMFSHSLTLQHQSCLSLEVED